MASPNKVTKQRREDRSEARAGGRSAANRRVSIGLAKVREAGFASWEGGKPKGSRPLIELSPGPDISGYVNKGRR